MKNKIDLILEAETELNILIQSCQEGLSGDWETETAEGREGFQDMIKGLEKIKKLLKGLKK